MAHLLEYNGKMYAFINKDEKEAAKKTLEHGLTYGDGDRLIEHMLRYNGIPLHHSRAVIVGVPKNSHQVTEYASSMDTEVALHAYDILHGKMKDSHNVYFVTPYGEVLEEHSIDYLRKCITREGAES